MPPRLEEELDAVTLHNQALVQMAEAPATGFRKLRFLLAHPPCPPETLGNLLLLQCRHQRYDVAADTLKAHSPLAFRLLSPVRAVPCVDVCGLGGGGKEGGGWIGDLN
jgi:tetratricopeptide repeat protein 30